MPPATDETYQLKAWARRRFTWSLSLLMLAGALEVLGALGDDGWQVAVGALLLASGGVGLVLVRLTRVVGIELDDDGLTFVAAWRRVRVPWADLVSLTPRWNVDAARWRRRTGRPIVTSIAFDVYRALVAEVQRRAPHVEVIRRRAPKPFWG